MIQQSKMNFDNDSPTLLFPNGIISDYIGCFEEDYADREFGVSVGNYETWDMTPEFCIKECAARSYS